MPLFMVLASCVRPPTTTFGVATPADSLAMLTPKMLNVTLDPFFRFFTAHFVAVPGALHTVLPALSRTTYPVGEPLLNCAADHATVTVLLDVVVRMFDGPANHVAAGMTAADGGDAPLAPTAFVAITEKV